MLHVGGASIQKYSLKAKICYCMVAYFCLCMLEDYENILEKYVNQYVDMQNTFVDMQHIDIVS